jgi:magnesium transporter
MERQRRELRERITLASEPSIPFTELPLERRREVFFTLPDSSRQTLLADLSRSQLESFVRYLDPDEATDVLGSLGQERRASLLSSLDESRREKVEFLLSFDPETAAGLMDIDYVTVDASRTPAEVIERVRRFEERTGRVPSILVTEGGSLVGRLPGAALSVAERDGNPVTDHVEEIPQVRYDRDDETVLEVLRTNRERSVVVLDDDDSVLGVVRADDVLTLAGAAAGETLYEFTGVVEAESVLDSPGTKVRRRYRWLILNLATAFLAAAVVGLFESTITAVAILAAYMPVVAGMGGNAGTQAMAVTVRGISLGQVSLATGRQVVANEVVAGGVNGLITGGLVAAVAVAFSFGEFGIQLGAVIGVSMVANLVIAGFFGAVTPLVLDRLGYDPATSATIFITTATDVLGFLVFLGLARLVLL